MKGPGFWQNTTVNKGRGSRGQKRRYGIGKHVPLLVEDGTSPYAYLVASCGTSHIIIWSGQRLLNQCKDDGLLDSRSCRELPPGVM